MATAAMSGQRGGKTVAFFVEKGKPTEVLMKNAGLSQTRVHSIETTYLPVRPARTIRERPPRTKFPKQNGAAARREKLNS